jgi:hypothetical protein
MPRTGLCPLKASVAFSSSLRFAQQKNISAFANENREVSTIVFLIVLYERFSKPKRRASLHAGLKTTPTTQSLPPGASVALATGPHHIFFRIFFAFAQSYEKNHRLRTKKEIASRPRGCKVVFFISVPSRVRINTFRGQNKVLFSLA